jgi:hypothetical protein
MQEINCVPQDPFHRVENTTTQTKVIAKIQEASRDMGAPRSGKRTAVRESLSWISS